MKPFQGQTAYYPAGDFRQYITQMIPVYNAARDEVLSYSVGIKFWAAVEPALVTAMRGNSAVEVEADREISLNLVLIRARYMPGVTIDTSQQLYNPSSGITYDVREVSDIAAAKRELHIVCREVK